MSRPREEEKEERNMENFIDKCTWVFPIRKSLARKNIKAGREGIQVALEMVRIQGRPDTIGDLMELDDRLEALDDILARSKDRVVYMDCEEMDLVTKRCSAFAMLRI